MTTVTAKEASALLGIMKSEYANENGRGAWVFSIKANTKGKALGGVLSSLEKKGLIEMGGDVKPNGAFGEDAYANLTALGLAFVRGEGDFRTTAERAPKIVANDSPIAVEPAASEPAETAPAAVLHCRPRTEKLIKLGIALCPSGKIFGAKSSCKCCGAVVPLEAVAAPKPKRVRKPKNDAPPVDRAKNAEAAEQRRSRRAAIALPSVGAAA